MRLFTMLAFLFWAALLPITSATAAPKGDVEKVIRLITNPEVKGTLVAPKHYKQGGVQVVFRQGGYRYTLYYTGKPNNEYGSNFLSVWVRKDGTSGGKALKTFTDNNVNGSVDFGLTGEKGKGPERKAFNSEDSLLREPSGAEFREFWQQEYDQAIAAALRRLH